MTLRSASNQVIFGWWIAVLALALGAVATFATSWAIAYWPAAAGSWTDPAWSAEHGPGWLCKQRHSFGETEQYGVPVSSWALTGAGPVPVLPPPAWSRLTRPADAMQSAVDCREEAFGWPMRAMSYDQLATSFTYVRPSNGRVTRKPHPTDDEGNRLIILPMRVLPAGFAVNTLLFAAILWPLIAMCWLFVGWLISQIRRRRGLCPRCGYDLKAAFDAGCPECAWNRDVPEI